MRRFARGIRRRFKRTLPVQTKDGCGLWLEKQGQNLTEIANFFSLRFETFWVLFRNAEAARRRTANPETSTSKKIRLPKGRDSADKSPPT